MTLHLPTILHTTIKIFIAFMTASYAATYMENDFPLEAMTWLSYLYIPAIGSMLSSCNILFCGLLWIPIYSLKILFHPNGRSLLNILQNPEGHGQFVWYNDDKNQHCWRERAHFVLWWAWHRCQCCKYSWWSNTSSDTLLIQGHNLRLCMFSFYQLHPTSINKTDGGPPFEDGVTNKVSVTTRSISVHHRSHVSVGVKLLHKLHPKVLPQGIISSFLVFLSTLSILAILSAIACHQ